MNHGQVKASSSVGRICSARHAAYCCIIVTSLVGVIWTAVGGDSVAEEPKALSEHTCVVRCGSCGAEHTISAAEYASEIRAHSHADGIPCRACGAAKARRIDVGISPSEADLKYVAQFESMSELEDALRNISAQVREAEQRIRDAAQSGVNENVAAELRSLKTRQHLLNQKWDRLALERE